MRFVLPFLLAPALAVADQRIDVAIDDHILPGYAALSEATEALANAQSCDVEAEWRAATEAWVAVSHLRFGPAEADNRAFSLAFWPDPRGATPRGLLQLLEGVGHTIDSTGRQQRKLHQVWLIG